VAKTCSQQQNKKAVPHHKRGRASCFPPLSDVVQINNQDQICWRVQSRDNLLSFIFRLELFGLFRNLNVNATDAVRELCVRGILKIDGIKNNQQPTGRNFGKASVVLQ
jgi:hypothetical protein